MIHVPKRIIEEIATDLCILWGSGFSVGILAGVVAASFGAGSALAATVFIVGVLAGAIVGFRLVDMRHRAMRRRKKKGDA